MAQAKWTKIKHDIVTFTEEFLTSHMDNSVNDNWIKIKDCINTSIQAHVPSRLTSVKQHNPWISNELKRKTRKKHRLYKKAKASGDPAQWQKFLDTKKQNKTDIKRARMKYINDRVVGDLENGNSKPIWRYLKSLRQDSFGVPALKVNGKLFTSAKDKARLLLQEFCSVFTIEDVSVIPWLGRLPVKITPIQVQSFGVKKLLLQLKPHKASGSDRLPNRILKELAHELAPSLTALYNQSLSTQVLPEDWKRAFISPVYKKGDVHTPGNYRPVSLTVVACKILEHIVCRHILNFLDENNVLTHAQHGFRKGHSCETQLLITLSDLFKSFDKRTQVDVGILDFSRAFDSVPHERLLGKLASCGVTGPVNSWIRAFLTGRHMSVVVDGEESNSAPVLSGVPQGTVLGPLLFLIYINDMTSQVSSGTFIRLFADDCLVYREINSTQDQVVLQQDLLRLQAWAELWGMRFNPSKCYIMHISRGQPSTKLYELCSVILQSVPSAKYLGVTIRSDLQWCEHVNYIAARANSTLHFIHRNLKYCPQSTRETAYCSLVRSTLEYCCGTWDPHLQKHITTLEKVNRRAVRVVFNKSWRDRNVSPTALMKQLGWQSLENRRYHQRMTMMYNISLGLVAVPPTELVKPQRSTRGHHFKYQTIGTNNNRSKYSFYPRSIPEWNSLNSDIVTAPFVDSFKSRLSKLNR